MPAVVTPFDTEGVIDHESHRHNVEYLTADGIAGFVIAGSTGEGPYLEPGERATLTAGARAVEPDAYLLCGVNGETLRAARAQIDEAVAGDADAALVITPTTLIRGREIEIEAFYADVADSSPLPVFLYTVPRVTGYELPVDLITRLSLHPNIAGMKDSGGDPTRIASLAGDVPESFAMFIGASRAVGAGIAAGGHGAITASANYCWPLLRRLLDAARAGDDAAIELQETLSTLTGTIEQFGIPATKAAAGIKGLRPGLPRRPLLPLHPSQYPIVERALG
jgi:dihydrodipicolinate synthase/N-acetylneuraminate lyase